MPLWNYSVPGEFRGFGGCFEDPDLRSPTRKVGVGIGIEAHIFPIPSPTPNIFMRHRVRHGA